MTPNAPSPVADALVTVPCLRDNYAFLFRTGDRVVCVDVPDWRPVDEALEARGWRLTDILLTHHHADHVGGVPDLIAATGAAVWGAARDAHRLPPLDHAVAAGDRIAIGDARGEVRDVSGHTVGHVAFVFPGVVFTGDSLMACGCGRLFEGDAAMLHASLGRLGDLPGETLVASGHEYTATNVAFARTVEPGNEALISRHRDTEAARAQGDATVPSTLALERDTNPFLRCGSPAIKRATGTEGASDVETFAALRRMKDAF
jgi:hydroxyacylglutathione hydrolase